MSVLRVRTRCCVLTGVLLAGPPRSCDSITGDSGVIVDACTAIIQADDAQEQEVERALRVRAAAYEQSGDTVNADRDRALATLLTAP